MIRAALLALSMIACGPRTPRQNGGEVPWASSGVDWSKPPAVETTTWTPPTLSEATLSNGIRILVVENHRLPLVAITALHRAAGSREDGGLSGVAAVTADALADRGARITANIATDHATQELVTTSMHLPDAVSVLAQTMRRPTLTVASIATVRDRRIAELAPQRTQTRRIAAQVFDRIVFGAHPYAEPAAGKTSSVARITVDNVQAFHARAYRPDRLTLVFAGDVTLVRARELVEAALGDWAVPPMPPPPPAALAPYAPSLGYVDIPGASEANVIVGRRAVAAGDARTWGGEVANSIVGGGSEARLDRELHGRLALTFGASSSFWRGSVGGIWSVAATFETARAVAGVRAMLAVLDDAKKNGPTDAELARARRDLTAGTRTAFESVNGSARAAVRLVVAALPLDHYARIEGRFAALSAAEVQQALDLSELSIVVVGDWAKLKEALSTLGLPVRQYEP